jgi:hypothetical protein
MLGKRKRELAVAPRQTSPTQGDGASGAESPIEDQDVFRRYFEATFEPLPHDENEMSQAEEVEEQTGQSPDEESAWEGLSDAGNEITTVQIVEHKSFHQGHDPDGDDDERQRQQYKQFMVSLFPAC